jgi:hypothetical protein
VLRRTLVVRLIWNHGLLLRTRVRFLVIPGVSETLQCALTPFRYNWQEIDLIDPEGPADRWE